MPDIDFFSEDISFSLADQPRVISWIKKVGKLEKREIDNLNYIFCSDKYLHTINWQYLKHDTLTDIITFDNSEPDQGMSGDIFISIERVKENASDHGVSFENELLRVIIHGVLHLCGHSDKNNAEKALMRKREDSYLSLW